MEHPALSRSSVGRTHQSLGTGQVTNIHPVRRRIPRFDYPVKTLRSIPSIRLQHNCMPQCGKQVRANSASQ